MLVGQNIDIFSSLTFDKKNKYQKISSLSFCFLTSFEA